MNSDDLSEDHGRQVQAYAFYVLVKEDFIARALARALSQVKQADFKWLLPILKDLEDFSLRTREPCMLLIISCRQRERGGRQQPHKDRSGDK